MLLRAIRGGRQAGVKGYSPLMVRTIGIVVLAATVWGWQNLAVRKYQLLQQETTKQAVMVRDQLHKGLQERIATLATLDWGAAIDQQPMTQNLPPLPLPAPSCPIGYHHRSGVTTPHVREANPPVSEALAFLNNSFEFASIVTPGHFHRDCDSCEQKHPHYSNNFLQHHHWKNRVPLVSLANNRETLDIYIPIFQEQKLAGFLPASACTKTLLENIITANQQPVDTIAGYAIAISDGSVEIYSQNVTRKPALYVAEVTIDLYGVNWQLQVWPLPKTIKKYSYTLPQTFLIIAGCAAMWLILSAKKVQNPTKAETTLRRRDGAIGSNTNPQSPEPEKMTADEQQKAELIRINEKLRHEINARGQLEEALLESQAVLAGILDNADDAIISVNEAQNITLFNQGAEKIFGYRAEEVLGKHIKIILPETLQEIYYQEARDGETGLLVPPSPRPLVPPSPLRGRWGREIFGRRQDGSQFPAEASVSLLQLGEKRIFTVILRDITERLGAEIALQESQTRLKLLNNIATSITSGMSVEQVISMSLKQIGEYFPGLRVAYATINETGYLKWLYSIEPPGMPSLKGLGMDLTAAPHLWQYLNHGVVNAVADLRQDSRLAAIAEVFTANATRAFLHVSLPPHTVMEGLLCFHSPAVRDWSQYEIYLLKDVADYLAVAINEARAQQERFEAKEELQRQSEANRAFSANLKQLHRLNTANYQNLASLFEDYLETGCKIFHMSAGAIVASNGHAIPSGVEPETERENSDSPLDIGWTSLARHDRPTIVAAKSTANWPPGWETELNAELICQLFKTNQTLVERNWIYEGKPDDESKYFSLQQKKLRFYIGTPILASQNIYGYLIFLSFHSISGYLLEEYEREIIEMMAQSIGKFIESHGRELERQNAVRELEKKQQIIQKIADANPNILYIYDIEEGRNVYTNREIAGIMGYTPAEITQMGTNLFQNMLHPDDLEKLADRLEKFALAKDGEIIETEYRMQDKNGEWHWLYSRDVVFSKTADGKPKQVLGTATDITDRKRVEHQLQEANEKLIVWVKELESHNREITLLGEMSDFLQACLRVEEACKAIATLIQPLFPDIGGAVFLINESNNLMEAVATWGNNSWGETVLAPHECWALRRGRLHSVDKTDSGLRCGHLHRVQHLEGSLCVPMMAQGETLGLLLLIASEPGQLTPGKKRLASMVAEHVSLALANLKLRETLEHQSIRDPLTGLFNRRYMEEFLELELRRASRKQQSLGVVMMDVDYFKRFNDTFGHEAGDTLLRELGMLLKNSLRGSDVACRYGGEELTLILPECSLADTLERAEQIRQEIKAMQVLHRGELLGAVTVSSGVACFPEHGSTGDAVIRAADMALYRAKKAGRDRSISAPS
ncbi:diguanylate cyclase [[Phormidium] sp. ETS-05]|uniref:diguanylate cyclase n=1 Tax=[Phormidium] sp. ETS-05 TaxID=222819 RepID=UPI0018EED76E|nr:diguanylate cyclase [[Phormidium] sp. ETS-05]